MKRFLKKKVLAAGVVLAGIVAFAGTCSIQHIALTNIGGNAVFAGEVHNDSGVNILQHNVAVGFIGYSYNLLEQKTVQPCLRTLPTGGVNYFSSQSSYGTSQVLAGLARVNFDSTFQVGAPATGNGTISNLVVNRNVTTLTVTGKFQNLDSTTLTSPNACAVVYSSAGNVIVVGLDQSLGDLVQNGSDTFSITLTVPNDSTLVSSVNVYVDGFKNNVPILPISDVGNAVTTGAAKLAFTQQPASSTGGIVFPTQPIVTLQNADGTTATTSTALVSLSITSGTGNASAYLTCSGGTTEQAVAGIATFSGCRINLASGTYYTLTATSTGVTSAASNAFYISVGPAAVALWTQQAGGGTGGTAWTTQPIVTLEDAGGNVRTGDNSSTVTLSILNNAGPGGVLTCTANPVTVVAGVATFAGCNIDKIGTGYTLSAVSGTVTSAAGAAFNITLGAAAKLAFTTQPGNASGHASSATPLTPQPVVSVEDAGGNLVATATNSITLTLTGTGTLACTTNPVTAVAGVATFAGCWVNAASVTTDTLTAAATGLTSATSTSFTVS